MDLFSDFQLRQCAGRRLYAGGLLAALGIALALGNWFGLALVAAVLTIAFAYRITVEEQALASALGAPYIAYMRKT
jgi:protein-S-isoprenylcysteine O-methyltransferase Ste14